MMEATPVDFDPNIESLVSEMNSVRLEVDRIVNQTRAEVATREDMFAEREEKFEGVLAGFSVSFVLFVFSRLTLLVILWCCRGQKRNG